MEKHKIKLKQFVKLFFHYSGLFDPHNRNNCQNSTLLNSTFKINQ